MASLADDGFSAEAVGFLVLLQFRCETYRMRLPLLPV